MDTHTTGRAKDAWRARNAGAEAPGDGQNVPRYADPGFFAGQAAPGSVGLPVTDTHVELHPEPEVDPTVDWPLVTGGGGGAPEQPAGLSTDTAPTRRPPGRPRKTD